MSDPGNGVLGISVGLSRGASSTLHPILLFVGAQAEEGRGGFGGCGRAGQRCRQAALIVRCNVFIKCYRLSYP